MLLKGHLLPFLLFLLCLLSCKLSIIFQHQELICVEKYHSLIWCFLEDIRTCGNSFFVYCIHGSTFVFNSPVSINPFYAVWCVKPDNGKNWYVLCAVDFASMVCFQARLRMSFAYFWQPDKQRWGYKKVLPRWYSSTLAWRNRGCELPAGYCASRKSWTNGQLKLEINCQHVWASRIVFPFLIYQY